MKRSTVVIATAALLGGCAGANVSSNLREPSGPEMSMATRCVDFTTGNEARVNALLQKYDGWKLAYVSEYTTENKSTTSMVMCFERPFP